MFWKIIMLPSSGSSSARSQSAWPWSWTHYVLQKAVCCSPKTQPSHLITQKSSAKLLAEHQTHYIYSESKSLVFIQCCYTFARSVYSPIKKKFTSAMVVLSKYGLNERAIDLWPASTKRALIALTPCTLSMSSGDLERLNSTDTFLRRENACTNFLLVP